MKQILTTFLLFVCLPSSAGEIIVNEQGNIHEALRKAREWRRTNDPRCKGGITITLQEGRYYMNEPLFLRPEDSGTKESPLIIRGTIKEQGDSSRQVVMERMIDFNPANRTITIPTPPDSVLQIFAAKKPPIEMVVHQRWAIAILRVKEMKVEGDKTVVSFMEPESRLEFEHPWPQPVIGGERGNSSFLLRTTEQRDGIEQLAIIDGACYVRFEGLTFNRTCWNRPLHKGHVTLQGGFPLVDAYKLKENHGLPWDEGLENQAWIERPVSAVPPRRFLLGGVRKSGRHGLGLCRQRQRLSGAEMHFRRHWRHSHHGRIVCRESSRCTPSIYRLGRALPTADHHRKHRSRCRQRGLGRSGYCIGLCTRLHHQQEPCDASQLLGHLRRLGMDATRHRHAKQPHHGSHHQ